jgi:hypothetical protein
MACRVCRRPLNTIGNPPTTYLHPLNAGTLDHEPVPVPASTLDTVARLCDFCGNDYPLWTLVGGDVAAITVDTRSGLLQRLGDRWAACATCTLLIDDNRPDAVVDRAARATGLDRNPEGRARIAQLHHAFLTHRQPGRTLITTTAWPAATVAARDLPRIRDRLTQLLRGPDGLPQPLPDDSRRGLADGLERAALYWIDPDFTDLAAHAAAQLPDAAILAEDAPAADGFVVWARPVTGELAAASWATTSGGWQVTRYRGVGGGLAGPLLQRVREHVGWLAPMGTRMVSFASSTSVAEPESPLLATWLLIAQQVADTAPAPISPETRRAYARRHRPPPDVRIVRLRQPARTGTSLGGTGEAGSRSFTARFWVTGHWRSQPYGPNRALRRAVYIRPFLKGPDGLPIRPTTAVRVLRADPTPPSGQEAT